MRKEEKFLITKLYQVHLRQALKAGGVVLLFTCATAFLASRIIPNRPCHIYLSGGVAALLSAWIVLRWNWSLREEKIALEKWKRAQKEQSQRVTLALDILQHMSDEQAVVNPTFLDSQSGKLTLRRQIREIRSAMGQGVSVMEGGPEATNERESVSATW